MRFTLLTKVLGGTGHRAGRLHRDTAFDPQPSDRRGVQGGGRPGTRRLTMAVALSGAMLLSPQACAPTPTRTEAATPAPVQLATAGATSMTVSWTPVGNARSYDIVYAGTGLAKPMYIKGVSATNRTITGLTAGGYYEAQVRAVTRKGPRAWSLAATITLGAATPAPAPASAPGPAPAPAPTPAPTPAPGPAPTPTPAPAPAPAPAPGGGAPVTGPLPAANPGTSASGLQSYGSPIRPSGDGTGNFRVTCWFSHMNSDDAIIFPGRAGAAHLHTYFGNVGSNASSTAASLLSTGNSTCSGGISNRSSYWVPSVLDAAGRPVAPSMNQVYYKSGYQGVPFWNVNPTLPNGLKIIAGNARTTSPQPRVDNQQIVSWTCGVNGSNGPTMTVQQQASIPTCSAGQDLWGVIRFPQCWDGVNLDSVDHMSHMAYGTYGVGCPASHPVALPEITYNIHWPVTSGTSAGWRLSSDMYSGPGGYSLHGDIITAWDTNISNTWLANCVRRDADCQIGIMADYQQLIYARTR